VAKSTKNDLFDRLRAQGLRSRVARTVSAAVGTGRRHANPPNAVRKVVDDLRNLANEIEDRATGGPAKRKAAAKKAAATRKRKANARSAAAKKAARTRAKSKS
jgi:hypothetical protein